MICIRTLLTMFVYVLSGYSLMTESAEYPRKSINPRNMLVHTKEIELLNNADIAKRTQKDIEWHNRRELAYRTRHEARMRDRKMYK